jgi:hypothetical protein
MGDGEPPLDVNANIQGWNAFTAFRNQLISELKVSTRSYIITDEGRDIRFSFDSGGLRITGDPYIYFWLYKAELPGYDQAAVRKRIEDEVFTEVKASASSTDGLTLDSMREAYIRMLLKQINKASEEYDDTIEIHPFLSKLITIQGDEERRAYLRDKTGRYILNLLIYLRVSEDYYTVVPLPQYSERLSSQPEMLRRINPLIWDTGVNVMRYAAFFRYYKATYPTQWQSFLAQLNRVTVPKVITPNIMKRTR